jgi:hypothetical protein
MSKMIQNVVYQLKADALVGPDMPLKKGQELEIVMDVVYVNGFPVPPAIQPTFYNWIKNNPDLFVNVTKNW